MPRKRAKTSDLNPSLTEKQGNKKLAPSNATGFDDAITAPDDHAAPAKKRKSHKKSKDSPEPQPAVSIYGTCHFSVVLIYSLETVCTCPASFVPLIDRWLDDYTSDPKPALLELINFLLEVSLTPFHFLTIQSCGCPKQLDFKEFLGFEAILSAESEESFQRIFETLGIANVERDRGLYPIVLKGKHQKFKPSFLTFWKKFFQQIPRDVIFDGYFLEKLFHWLLALAQSVLQSLLFSPH